MEQSCDDRAAEVSAEQRRLSGRACSAPLGLNRRPPVVAAFGSAVVERFHRFLGSRERQLDVGGVYWALVVVLGTALLLTSVEFEAREVNPGTWAADSAGLPTVTAPQPLALPEVEEQAVMGERATRRDFRPIYPGEALPRCHRGIRGGGVPDLPRRTGRRSPDRIQRARRRVRRRRVEGRRTARVHLGPRVGRRAPTGCRRPGPGASSSVIRTATGTRPSRFGCPEGPTHELRSKKAVPPNQEHQEQRRRSAQRGGLPAPRSSARAPGCRLFPPDTTDGRT